MSSEFFLKVPDGIDTAGLLVLEALHTFAECAFSGSADTHLLSTAPS